MQCSISLFFLDPLFSPFLGTLCTLVKRRHRLIRTPNLQLIPIRLIIPTLFIRALDPRAIDIVPGTLATQNVLDLLLLEVLALVVALADDEVVGAGQAFEPVLALVGGGGWVAGGNGGDAQHVGAGGAEE